MTEGIEPLREAIRNTHGCDSEWVEAMPVKETFQGRTIWEGEVQVFKLIGHADADRCYAWSHAVGDSDRRRFVTVLHKEPVTSPEAAVRAAIIQEANER